MLTKEVAEEETRMFHSDFGISKAQLEELVLAGMRRVLARIPRAAERPTAMISECPNCGHNWSDHSSQSVQRHGLAVRALAHVLSSPASSAHEAHKLLWKALFSQEDDVRHALLTVCIQLYLEFNMLIQAAGLLTQAAITCIAVRQDDFDLFCRLVCDVQESNVFAVLLPLLATPPQQVVVDVRHWTRAVRVASETDGMHAAESVVNGMKTAGVMPSVDTFNVLLNGWRRKGDMERVSQILNNMTAADVKPDVRTFKVLMKGWGQKLDMERAMHLLDEMKAVGVLPEAIIFNTLIRGWMRLRQPDMERATRLLDAMDTAEVKPNVDTFNMLMSGWA
jgi:pentatricopeptide repeat protein